MTARDGVPERGSAAGALPEAPSCDLPSEAGTSPFQAALLAAMADVVWWTGSGRTRPGRRGWTAFTGQAADGAAGMGWLEAVHPHDRDQVARAFASGQAGGLPFTSAYRLHHAASRAWRWVVDRAVPWADPEGGVAWVGVITDDHVRKTGDLALRASEERLRLALEASAVGLWDVDLVEGTRFWSDRIRTMLGVGPDAAASEATLLGRVHPADRGLVREANQAWARNGLVSAEVVFRIVREDDEAVRWIASSGRACLDGDGRAVRRAGIWQDITERRLAEEKVWAAANLDPLTALANRSLFQSRLKEAVGDAAASGCGVGLLLIDLDHFKEINDTLGHDAGDAVLRAMAGRVTACVPGAGMVARLGGDEFAVLLPGAGRDGVGRVAQAIVAAMAVPIHEDALALNCSVSVGSSLFPADGDTGAGLLKSADLALYAAKAAGRNRHAPFEPALSTAIERRVAVLRSVRDALDLDALVPFYQPKVFLASGAVLGLEALPRWRGPAGPPDPAAVGDAFEDPELAVRIGDRMLAKVIADAGAWCGRGLAFGRIALNVSGTEFATTDVAERVLSGLRAAKLPPGAVEVEVVESVLLNDASDRTLALLHRLEAQGVTLSLDHFGTGYASLAHLRRYPVTWLKVDRSFTRDLSKGGAGAAIVRAVIGLAHDLGMSVVAEGVEAPTELRVLARFGCDAVQGPLVAKPMPASRVPFFLRTGSGPVSGLPAAAPSRRLAARSP